MEIRNAMEALVQRAVADACADRVVVNRCVTEQCQIDVQCYVLNRLPPRYVSSSRGVAHLMRELEHDQQLQIDVMRLVKEGIDRVSAVQRAYYGTSEGHGYEPGMPLFNFPTVKGRILHGATFETLADAEVELFFEGERAPMFDERWQNPYRIAEATAGTFLFWPAPQPADEHGTERVFSCSVVARLEGFAPLEHGFNITLRSETAVHDAITLDNDLQLTDLYLFPGR